jgi:hypothetical protein
VSGIGFGGDKDKRAKPRENLGKSVASKKRVFSKTVRRKRNGSGGKL